MYDHVKKTFPNDRSLKHSDCYSTPPDCEAAYHEVWGQGLVSTTGLVVINDTNATQLANLFAASGDAQELRISGDRAKTPLPEGLTFTFQAGPSEILRKTPV